MKCLTWEMVNPEPIPDPDVRALPVDRPVDAVAEYYAQQRAWRFRRFVRAKAFVEWVPAMLDSAPADRLFERCSEEEAIERCARVLVSMIREEEARMADIERGLDAGLRAAGPRPALAGGAR